MKTKISVVIIAKNEEKIIRRCLESVIGWAGEVIVVDGQSADRTVDISRSMGARVVEHKFTGAFADDRNAGLDAAANDWVLQLDADDVVTEGFRKKMEEAMPLERDDTVAYKFRRKNFFLGHYMEHGGFCHYIPNFVRRSRVRYEGEVHEVPVYKGSLGTIDADIEHRPFDSIGQFMERQNRYTDIASRDLFRKDPSLDDKKVFREMVYRSFKIFWKSYVRKEGYKEGRYGFIFAVLFAFINFLKWAKYWHLCKAGDNDGPK